MKTMKALTLVLILGLISGIARADEAKEEKFPLPSEKRYLSLFGGVGIGTSKGSGNFGTYAGRFGTMYHRDSSGIAAVGIFAGTTSSSQTASGITVNENVTAVMAEIVTKQAWGTPLYLGARAGLGLVNAQIKTTTLDLKASATSFAFAPVVGAEVPITENISLDFDASWITVLGGTLVFPTAGSVTYDASQSVLLQGGLTYHW